MARECLQREEHVFGAFEITHYRPKERASSVKDRTSEEWRGSLVATVRRTGEALFPELIAELDAIKKTMVSGLVFRRDHEHRKSPTPLP